MLQEKREAPVGSPRGSEHAAASGGSRQAEIGNFSERLRDHKVSRISAPCGVWGSGVRRALWAKQANGARKRKGALARLFRFPEQPQRHPIFTRKNVVSEQTALARSTIETGTIARFIRKTDSPPYRATGEHPAALFLRPADRRRNERPGMESLGRKYAIMGRNFEKGES